jgi:hypothetical protein
VTRLRFEAADIILNAGTVSSNAIVSHQVGLSSRCSPFHELLLQHSINRPLFENGVLVCWLDFVTGNADPKPSKKFMARS